MQHWQHSEQQPALLNAAVSAQTRGPALLGAVCHLTANSPGSKGQPVSREGLKKETFLHICICIINTVWQPGSGSENQNVVSIPSAAADCSLLLANLLISFPLLFPPTVRAGRPPVSSQWNSTRTVCQHHSEGQSQELPCSPTAQWSLPRAHAPTPPALMYPYVTANLALRAHRQPHPQHHRPAPALQPWADVPLLSSRSALQHRRRIPARCSSTRAPSAPLVGMSSYTGRFWGGSGDPGADQVQHNGCRWAHASSCPSLPTLKRLLKHSVLCHAVWQPSCSLLARPLGPHRNNTHMLLGQRPAFILRGGLGSKQSSLIPPVHYSGLLDHKWPFRLLRCGLRGALWTNPNDLSYGSCSPTSEQACRRSASLCPQSSLGWILNPLQENVTLVPLIMIQLSCKEDKVTRVKVVAKRMAGLLGQASWDICLPSAETTALSLPDTTKRPWNVTAHFNLQGCSSTMWSLIFSDFHSRTFRRTDNSFPITGWTGNTFQLSKKHPKTKLKQWQCTGLLTPGHARCSSHPPALQPHFPCPLMPAQRQCQAASVQKTGDTSNRLLWDVEDPHPAVTHTGSAGSCIALLAGGEQQQQPNGLRLSQPLHSSLREVTIHCICDGDNIKPHSPAASSSSAGTENTTQKGLRPPVCSSLAA